MSGGGRQSGSCGDGMVPSAMEGVCFIAALKDSCGHSVAMDTRKSSEGGRNSSHEKDKRDRITRRVAWQPDRGRTVVVERSRWLEWQEEETLGLTEEEKERNLWSSNFPVLRVC